MKILKKNFFLENFKKKMTMKNLEQQKQRASTRSSNPGFRNETRQALETGVLRYEVDIYKFIKSLFYEKLNYYGIPQPENL